MLDLLGGFIQSCGRRDCPVSLTENLDAMEAVKHIPIEDRDAFKSALAATLVKNNAHWRAFETVFEVYFSLRGPEFAVDGEGDGDQWGEMQGQAAAGRARRRHGAAHARGARRDALPGVAERRRGDDAGARPAGRAAVRGHGARAARRRHVLPVPHAAEPRPRRHAREADGGGAPRGRRRPDSARGAPRARRVRGRASSS